MAIQNFSSVQGTVQTLECRRDGDLRWSKSYAAKPRGVPLWSNL